MRTPREIADGFILANLCISNTAIAELIVEVLKEKDAETERLSTALGQATADLMGCRDGALVRDLKARVAQLEAEIAKLEKGE